MKKILLSIVVVVMLFAAGRYYVRSYYNPCSRQVVYSMGSYDPRFGITQEQFLKIVEDMEAVWEEPLQKDMFRYDPNGKFKINLVFDERQQKTLDANALRQTINLKEESYEKLVEQYNNLNFYHKQDLVEFNAKREQYENRLRTYNAEVKHWNEEGGAPTEEFKRLTEEKKALSAQMNELDRLRLALNSQVNDLNALGARINEQGQKLNKDVEAYNGKFGTSRRFDQGTYTGNAINIFQFNEEADLRLVVAHELGHVLRLDHIEEPKAIMYYLMDQQDLSKVAATQADIQALKAECGIKE